MKKTFLPASLTSCIAGCSLFAVAFGSSSLVMAQHNTSTPQYGMYDAAHSFEYKVPFNNTDNLFERMQLLYRSAELVSMSGSTKAPSGNITKVYLHAKATAKVYTLTDVIIKLTQTTDTCFAALTPTSPDVPFYTCTEVFNQKSYSVSTPGWIEFTLSKPFKYDNTKNLVLEVSGDNGFNTTTNNANKRANYGRLNDANGAFGFSIHDFGFDMGNATSVNEIDATTAVEIYPNPATDQVRLAASKAISGSIIITDINGKTITTEKINGTQCIIPVSGMANGMYFYKVFNNENILLSAGKVTIAH
ncbi:MAG: T9SS type A sorting domain-containing protein [Bacteroidetes bacterium]|nr:T9SS type A sorting domain-containing protein [Bacteroidota bacterium]